MDKIKENEEKRSKKISLFYNRLKYLLRWSKKHTRDGFGAYLIGKIA